METLVVILVLRLMKSCPKKWTFIYSFLKCTTHTLWSNRKYSHEDQKKGSWIHRIDNNTLWTFIKMWGQIENTSFWPNELTPTNGQSIKCWLWLGYGWTSTKSIFGFTLVTRFYKGRFYILIENLENRWVLDK